jgi:glycosyltransferase involved in cell wall biosynthesis
VHLADFAGKESKNRKRLICSSTDPKVLSTLPIIFEKLKKKHSGLELHLFKNEAVLFPKMEGCFLHLAMNPKQMAREWLKSSIFINPSNDPDDSGITAMEAQAGGCATVSTYFEDMADIVGDAGLLIPQQSDYTDHFIDSVDRVLSDDAEYMRLCQNALKRRHELDWKCRGRELLRYLKEIHGMD